MSGADKSDCASWCYLEADHDGPCRARCEIVSRETVDALVKLAVLGDAKAAATGFHPPSPSSSNSGASHDPAWR